MTCRRSRANVREGKREERKDRRAGRQGKEGKEGEGGMPASREEWALVMLFWSERLGRRLDVGGGDVYEVVSGRS